MKILIVATLMTITLMAADYTNSFCHDDAQSAQWDALLNRHGNSEPLLGLHALWLGLCRKIDQHEMTTAQAERIFHKQWKAVMGREEHSLPQEGSL